MCRTEPACALALAAQQGDDAAKWELYLLTMEVVGRYARHKIYDPAAAADVVFDCFQDAVVKYNPEAGRHFPSFMRMKLDGDIIDWYRAEERRRKRERLAGPDTLPEIEEERFSGSSSDDEHELPAEWGHAPSREEWEKGWEYVEPQTIAVIEAKSTRDFQVVRRTAALRWIDRFYRAPEDEAESFEDLARELGIGNKLAGRAIRWVWPHAVDQLLKGKTS